MDEKIDKRFCPSCGQPMKPIKGGKKTEIAPDTFERLQLWHCLNCSEEWQIDIMNNILRKNAIIEE